MQIHSSLHLSPTPTSSYSPILSWKLSSCIVGDCRQNNWPGHALASDSYSIHYQSSNEGHFILYVGKMNLDIRRFWENEIWSKCQGNAMFMKNELFFLLSFRISVHFVFLSQVSPTISHFQIFFLSLGQSVSGVTWPCLCLCSPCASVVSRGCRNAGSVTVTS